MNVLFVNYHDFTSNSAIHIFHLANRLADLGTSPMVCVPDRAGSVDAIGTPRFKAITFDDARRNGAVLGDWAPDIIHAWTPRERVRRVTVELAQRYKCPYVVHLEDNEEQIVADSLGTTVAELSEIPTPVLDKRIPPGLSHPKYYREFLAGSEGVTALIDRLLEFKPTHVPGEVFWPAYDEDLEWSKPTDYPGRRALGLRDDDFVLVYTGNVHRSNRREVLSLYLAVGLLNRRGISAKLIRTGVDHDQLLVPELKGIRQHCVELGYRPRAELPSILAMADALVQPGGPSDFNDYRFPSKLPEFFATGKPVMLPRTNVGRHLKDGEECVLLEEGNALEIARRLEQLAQNRPLRDMIGLGGAAFAHRNFSWRKSAELVRAFYGRVLSGHSTAVASSPAPKTESPAPSLERPPLMDDATVAALADRYKHYPVPSLGYATVRDFCDSMDHLRPLATANGDLKDVQRPWIVKAILATVPRGGRLLEVGAGEPLVAELLRRLGYDVTVVDPYEGLGNGPREYEAFVQSFPHLKFVRRYFANAVPELPTGSFDCIYSISVLEHVPDRDIPSVFSAIRHYLKPGGRTIHAIDYVLLGAGDTAHHHKTSLMLDQLGSDRSELNLVLQNLQHDPDAYFLAATGHNLWRGNQSYDAFPMRRCISVNVNRILTSAGASSFAE